MFNSKKIYKKVINTGKILTFAGKKSKNSKKQYLKKGRKSNK